MTEAPAKPFLANHHEAPAYWHVDILWAMLATGKQTNGQYSLIEELCPRDSGPPPHIHVWMDEAFYIIEGEVHFEAGGNALHATAGSFVSIPRGTPHSFRITSDTARVLNFYSPAGFEEMVMELGEPASMRVLPPKGTSDPKDPEKVKALAQKVGMRPVP